MNCLTLLRVLCLLSILVIADACVRPEVPGDKYTGWSSYLGGPDRNHYSTLSQITLENVRNLKPVWRYNAPDYGQMQMNPIVVDTILYGVTAALRVIALHAATGKEIWRFGDSTQIRNSTSRGVSYWAQGGDKRILFSRGSDLFALNALTGKPILSFGQQGKIDLRSGMPHSAADKFVISNTPGTVYKDLIIMPLRLSEDVGAAPGDIMAFHIPTGKLAWVFHPIPYPGTPGYETWENKESYRDNITGAANNWAGMALDEETATLFVPTGSAAPDFYGGFRKGSNLYSNCLLALDAGTGKLKWHFQFTHHDLWDRDPPAPPNLLMVKRDGRSIPAVAQVTKQGYVFVFDRNTGKPLFEIAEEEVPASTLNGEKSWESQPYPTLPAPFARQSRDLTRDDISPYAENREELIAILDSMDLRRYAPPALEPVLLLPGFDGGAEWGGAAADPEEGILYVNANEMAWILKMRKRDTILENLPAGRGFYDQYCMVCHQADRRGIDASGYPSLLTIGSRMKKEELETIIMHGKGMMTGFPQLKTAERDALVRFLLNQEDKEEAGAGGVKNETLAPYVFTGYNKFLDKGGLPAISPPWGTLHAIDLNSGKYRWSVPFGETPELKDRGIKGTGTENYGGAVVTRNGLLFIGATRDGYFRVFNKQTGEIIWEYLLPAAAFATPAMYEVDGRQFIAIACGGEKLGTKKGNQIIAFALD